MIYLGIILYVGTTNILYKYNIICVVVALYRLTHLHSDPDLHLHLRSHLHLH
jgi:hypothetical protein